MNEYKEIQIIKHALGYYIKRPDATEKDLQEERTLLEKYESKAESTREKFGICKKQ